MDDFNIICELFNQSIDNDIGVLTMVVSEFDVSMYAALEECELACMIEGTALLMESSDSRQMQSCFEGAVGNLFGKIAELIKRVANKIAEVVKSVFEKFKKFLNWIKGLLKKVATGGKGTKWPNGFDIDFMKGTLEISNLSVAGAEFEVFVCKGIITCAQFIRSNDLDRLQDWYTKNEDITSLKPQYPQEYFNKRLGVKIGKEENCIKTWIEDIFDYKQYGPDYDVPLSKIRSLVDTAVNARGVSELAGIEQDLLDTCVKMRGCGDKIEALSKGSPNPQNTKYIQGLSQLVVRYAEFTSIISTQAIKFASTKYTEMTNFLVDNKWCVKLK